MPDRSRFRDTADFAPTIDAASEHLGISATAVEKDYWVSEVLRVFAHKFPADFIFKGGTSLSKAYRLIQRFSEDIDVLVSVPSTLGICSSAPSRKNAEHRERSCAPIARREEGAYPKVCNRRATQRAEMQGRSNASEISAMVH